MGDLREVVARTACEQYINRDPDTPFRADLPWWRLFTEDADAILKALADADLDDAATKRVWERLWRQYQINVPEHDLPIIFRAMIRAYTEETSDQSDDG